MKPRHTVTVAAMAVCMLVIASAGLLGWGKYMSAHKSDDLIITTKGLGELGIKLEAPYGSRSLKHVLLVNEGPHHLLAYDVVFEFVTPDGQVFPARYTVCNSFPLREKDPARRKIALAEEPGAAPNSKWLLDISGNPGYERVDADLPPLTEGGPFEVISRPEDYKQLNIKLQAVIIETGQAFGPLAQEFLRYVHEELLEERQENEK